MHIRLHHGYYVHVGTNSFMR